MDNKKYISVEDAIKTTWMILDGLGYAFDENPQLTEAVLAVFDTAQTADVRPVVLCRDCVYWQKPQVKLNDGTYRDYEPGEYENGSFFGGVTSDVGINIGSFCAKYDKDHLNRIPQFMGESDFCSKGYKLREES